MMLEFSSVQKATTIGQRSKQKEAIHLGGVVVTPRDLPGHELPQHNYKGVHVCRAVILRGHSLQCKTLSHADSHLQHRTVNDCSMSHSAICAFTAA